MHIEFWTIESENQLKKWLLLSLIGFLFTIIIVGCRQDLQQTPVEITVIPTHTAESIVQVSPLPEVATALATEAQGATVTPTQPAAATPTSQPCAPPADWVSYIIQPGDTLSSLANVTQTTVPDIKAANCMFDDSIIVGEALFLPFAPPTPRPVQIIPTAPITVEPPDTPEPRCMTRFSCPDPNLDMSLNIDPGGGNDPTFVPCESDRSPEPGKPWIDSETFDLEQGERAYFFACDFPDEDDTDEVDGPTEWDVSVVGPNGNQLEVEVDPKLNPDLKMGAAQLIVAWNATCDLPVDSYTLTIADKNDAQGAPAPITLELTAPRFQRIMIVPQVETPGTTFDIYYCGYTARANQEIEIDIYYEYERGENGRYSVALADTWTVMINADGWAMEEVISSTDDPIRAYFINDRDLALEGSVQLWLVTE